MDKRDSVPTEGVGHWDFSLRHHVQNDLEFTQPLQWIPEALLPGAGASRLWMRGAVPLRL